MTYNEYLNENNEENDFMNYDEYYEDYLNESNESDREKLKRLKAEYKEYRKQCKSEKKKPKSFKEFLYDKHETVKKVNAGAAAAGIVSGAVAAKAGHEAYKGFKRVYHATQNRKDNPNVLKSIDKEGLTRRHGGEAGSKADTEAALAGRKDGSVADAQENNRGQVQYGKLSHVVQYVTRPKYTKGSKLKDRKIYKIDLPYDDYKKSKTDVNISKAIHQIGHVPKKAADKITDVTTGAKMMSHKDIDPRLLVNNKAYSKKEKNAYRKEIYKDYVKNHKGRHISGGAATVAGGAAAVAGTGLAVKTLKDTAARKKAYKKYEEQGGKLSYKEFCIKAYKNY